MKILIFGAGSTGRAHLGLLLYEGGYRDLTFIDKKCELIEALNKEKRYKVQVFGKEFGKEDREVEVTGFKAISRYDETKIVEAFNEADLVLTSVIAENLENVSEIIAKSIIHRNQMNNGKLLNIICCENLDNASSYLKSMVFSRLNSDDIKYCEDYIGFPDAMISRVVPVAAENPLYLITEDYNEWTVNKKDYRGNDPDIPFMEIIDNLSGRLERKLWIHNGGHATVAYAAWLKGYKYIHEAIKDPEITTLAGKVMDEIGDAVRDKYGFPKEEIDKYKNDLVVRGSISEMRDEISRVVRNPIRKLGLKDRLLAPAIYAHSRGLNYENIIESAVNATLYCSHGDMESIKMQEVIKTKGYDYFLAETLGLKVYPEILRKMIDKREQR